MQVLAGGKIKKDNYMGRRRRRRRMDQVDMQNIRKNINYNLLNILYSGLPSNLPSAV
jgi:hypothetical protein